MLKTTNYFSTFETENNTLKRITTAEGQAVPMGEKGLRLHAFVIMTKHLHLIISKGGKNHSASL